MDKDGMEHSLPYVGHVNLAVPSKNNIQGMLKGSLSVKMIVYIISFV
jgi:hypothetical protein